MKLSLKQIGIFIPVVLLAACSNTNPEKEFELKGKLTNAHGETLYLEHMSTTVVSIIDSATLNNNGEFSMKTNKVKDIGFYRLKITNSNFTTFIFSPGEKVSLTGDAGNLVASYNVSGSHVLRTPHREFLCARSLPCCNDAFCFRSQAFWFSPASARPSPPCSTCRARARTPRSAKPSASPA